MEYPITMSLGGGQIATVSYSADVGHPCPCLEKPLGGPPQPQNLQCCAKICCALGCTVLLGAVAAIAVSATSDLSPAAKGGIFAAAGASILGGCCICFRWAHSYSKMYVSLSNFFNDPMGMQDLRDDIQGAMF
ncbi:hypothetical protein AAKU58_003112 [Oxalobacteraceae bacterium GrIS 1.18]